MQIITTVRQMQQACLKLRRKGTLGLVPTMGALHDGHLSLVRRAQGECDSVVVSIFVNPTQFAAGEDFETYPRAFEEDCAKLKAAGIDLLIAPSAEEMYAPGAITFVEVPGIGDRLDGASRPGHFRGVATVVAKLFNIVGPDRAYFGQKDAAQVAVLRAMIRDLNFPVQLVACPIVRERDGLAMSSRNRYLSLQDRLRALILHRALETACELLEGGESRAEILQEAISRVFAADEGIRLDYAEIVDPCTLLPIADTSQGALIAVAAWVGSTRLIDNILTENLQIESLHLRHGLMEETHA
ncbi:MAG TPA: pantoate--beta-alanine ligase [Acidobacteriaceae bacterium]|jgi:pantoate--beta-alanine ligase|nr:pantoate--beta-alanine ligase [Acidobacteriaceae bacterium]